MRSWFGRRALAAVAAVFVLTALIEPAGLDVCPMHSATAATAPAAPESHDAHHQHDGAAQQSVPANADHHSDECRCIADCLGGASALVAPEFTASFALNSRALAHVPAPPADAPITRGGLVLPFATAPPARA